MRKEKKISLELIVKRGLSRERYKVRKLLNKAEAAIQACISASGLISHFNLVAGANGRRCICHFHKSTSNVTSMSFDDSKKTFNCFAHGEKGRYIDFIKKMLGDPYDGLNKAKLAGIITFTNVKLKFKSLEDHDRQIEEMIRERYKETGSLFMSDYEDVTFLTKITKKSY